jgi:carbamoyl-phosphate synthase large subunit
MGGFEMILSGRTVMFTGAGGTSIPTLITAMRAHGMRVLVADMDPHAPGLILADKGFIIPAGRSERFLTVVRKICQDEHVDAFVPLVDEELLASTTLEDDGVAVILPRKPFIETCLDKVRLNGVLERAGIPVPRTRPADEGAGNLRFPLVLKPRTGRGSRGLVFVRQASDLTEAFASHTYAPKELMLQEAVSGAEYTVSVVAWRDGGVQAVVPKRVILKRGVTRLAVTEHIPEIERVCGFVQERLRADGPFNVQLCLDVDGMPRIFEINPRFSTTVTLTMRAGIDEVFGMIVQALLGREAFVFGVWEQGVVLVRPNVDQFISLTEYQNAKITDAASWI